MEVPERFPVNKIELAQILRCSLPTLRDLMIKYPDFPVERAGAQGLEWQFDAEKVTAFLERQRAEAAEAEKRRAEFFKQFTLPIDDMLPGAPAALSPTQRASLARARLAERKLAVETRTLVVASEIRQVAQATMTRLGRFLDGLAGRVAREHGLPAEVERSIRKLADEGRVNFVRDLQASLREQGDLAALGEE